MLLQGIHPRLHNIYYNISKIEVNRTFNPSSPHIGSLWESGVKSTKAVLRRLVGVTILMKKWAILLLRSKRYWIRGLCVLSNSQEPEETNYLSPEHLLTLYRIVNPPDISLLDSKDAGLSRWQHLQTMIQHFWKIWRIEYLSPLQRRGKLTRDSPNPKEGDLVLLKDDNIPFLHCLQSHDYQDSKLRVQTTSNKTRSSSAPWCGDFWILEEWFGSFILNFGGRSVWAFQLVHSSVNKMLWFSLLTYDKLSNSLLFYNI